MADTIRYYNSSYTYISPVRYFKANDPYYYEVDNLPIKQLEESQNFLKDQIDGLITRSDNLDIEIDRSGFSELKPYATGNDRKIRVKPGRFTARINDAYSISPLQVIEQVAGLDNIAETDEWRTQTNISTGGSFNVTSVLEEFQKGLQGSEYNMNGLAERAFVFPVDNEDGVSNPNGPNLLRVFNPDYSVFDSEFDPDERPLYPNQIGAILKHSTESQTRDLSVIRNIYSLSPNELESGSQQGRLESEFIKRWRGATRTSVVDVAEEIEITVPDFDANDFYYIDSAGARKTLDCNQRIDLLFIYSKPVDSSFTTLSKFDTNGVPTVITKPTLGILKGAGLGMSRQTAGTNATEDDRVNLNTLDGTPVMLAHPGDISGLNGFEVSGSFIRGSFPSPDDLLNLAPLLSENLETDAYPLIGQSILPIAYITVRKAGNGGPITNILSNDDIIDIRPFFRTTELSYNERAGIAAATPQVSIANPFVTEAQLGKISKILSSRIDEVIASVGANTAAIGTTPSVTATPTPTTPVVTNNNQSRVIAAGSVLGGYWGPEGALIKHAKSTTGGGILTTPMNQFVDLVENEFGYPAGSIPYLPDWDKATWHTKGEFTDDKICDHINIGAPWLVEPGGYGGNVKYMPPWVTGVENGQLATVDGLRDGYGFVRAAMYDWSPVANSIGNVSPNWLNPLDGSDSYRQDRTIQLNFVKKRIQLDFSNTPWVKDYQVKANFLHCTPLSEGVTKEGAPPMRNSSNIWIQKFNDYFVICIAWAGNNLTFNGYENEVNLPWADRDNPEKFAGFTQPQMELLGGSTWNTYGAQEAGLSDNQQQNARDLFFKDKVNKTVSQSAANYADPDFFNAVVPILYPSIQWEVVGLSQNVVNNSANMSAKDPTVSCL